MNPDDMNVKDKFGKRFNEEAEWFEFYGYGKEEMPDNSQEALFKEVEITMYVDADHTGNQLTHCSHPRIFIFFNMKPIIWHSNR